MSDTEIKNEMIETGETTQKAESGEAKKTTKKAETGEAKKTTKKAETGEAKKTTKKAESGEAKKTTKKSETGEAKKTTKKTESGETKKTTKKTESGETKKRVRKTSQGETADQAETAAEAVEQAQVQVQAEAVEQVEAQVEAQVQPEAVEQVEAQVEEQVQSEAVEQVQIEEQIQTEAPAQVEAQAEEQVQAEEQPLEETVVQAQDTEEVQLKAQAQEEVQAEPVDTQVEEQVQVEESAQVEVQAQVEEQAQEPVQEVQTEVPAQEEAQAQIEAQAQEESAEQAEAQTAVDVQLEEQAQASAGLQEEAQAQVEEQALEEVQAQVEAPVQEKAEEKVEIKEQAEEKPKEVIPNEMIGKVTLDLAKYPGRDLYSDGAVEEELLKIARNLSPVEYAKAIDDRGSWPVLYHFSKQRENIVEWIPIKETDKVLEVGSGCGAIAGALARKAGSVTCVDLSRMRSRINAYRHSDCENMTIKVGNFTDVEPELDRDYDLICLIGAFEYGISYIGGDTPFEDFLKIVMAHVKPGGRIVIAIENKLGLKYFAGCKEDHMGTYFSGITNYVDGGHARTFSRQGLEKIFASCGVREAHFYYPYPDYKFMTMLFSDKRLPGKGELSNNLRNFDRDRIMLFDEKNAFDGICEDGLFPVFSNSFLVVLGPDYETEYVRYSNDRAPQFQICTEILGSIGRSAWQQEKLVRKRPLCEEAAEHVRAMENAYVSLAERFAGSELNVNRCRLEEVNGLPQADFEYVKGTTLSELMDRALDAGDEKEFQRLFLEYLRRIDYNSDLPIADFDLVFSNLLVNGDQWTLIDYEWTFGKAMDTRELAFRAIYCYILEDEKRERLPLEWVLDVLKISPEEAEGYRRQEEEFQKYVEGQRLSMAKLREKIGKKVIKPWKLIESYQDSESICRVQVYEDKGNGYREEDSYFVKDAFITDHEVEVELNFDGNVKTLRIDPIMDSCVVKVTEMTLNGERVPLEKKKILLVNGRSSGGKNPSIVFPTEDPNLGINVAKLNLQAQNTLCATMEVTRLPKNAAEDLCRQMAKRIRF